MFAVGTNSSWCNYKINVTTKTTSPASRGPRCEWEAKRSNKPNGKRRANAIIVWTHERNPEAIKVKRSWTSFAVMLTAYGQTSQRYIVRDKAVKVESLSLHQQSDEVLLLITALKVQSAQKPPSKKAISVSESAWHGIKQPNTVHSLDPMTVNWGRNFRFGSKCLWAVSHSSPYFPMMPFHMFWTWAQ